MLQQKSTRHGTSHRKALRLRRAGSGFGLFAAGLACFALAATAVSAGASTANARGGHASSSVVADKAYFKGKTITIINPGSAGGGNDLTALAYCPYIAAYLHATCSVETLAGGGTIPGQNAAMTAAPNGLTIGMVQLAGDLGDFFSNTPGIEFSLQAVPILGAIETPPQLLVASPGSGLKTFTQMVESKTPVSVLGQAGGSDQYQIQLMFGGYQILNKFIYGYGGGSAILAGFIRGDGETSWYNVTAYEPLIVEHQAVGLLQSNPAIKGETGYQILKSIPTLAQYAAAHPRKTKESQTEVQMLDTFSLLPTAFGVSVGTPQKLILALRDAFQFASTKGGFQQQMLSSDQAPTYITPETVKSDIKLIIKNQSTIQKWLAETGAPPAG